MLQCYKLECSVSLSICHGYLGSAFKKGITHQCLFQCIANLQFIWTDICSSKTSLKWWFCSSILYLERPVWSLEHLVLIGQNGRVYLITTAATVWHPQPNDGYQLCKQPPHPRSIFILFEQQCYISWPPLSTTHTGHSKQKIHSIDPPVSPQLLFPNSHWGQITSALPFHPVTMAEQ